MHLLQYFDKLSLKPENAKDLKGLILDLAIRGRLTEEWRKENLDIEPASVLLEKIKEEKTLLIKEKKIRKEKSLPEIGTSEKPFQLPDTWNFCHFTDLGIIGSSKRVHKKDWQTSGIPFYRAREIVKLAKLGNVDNNLFISDHLFEELSTKGLFPEKDDIMITGVGTIGIPYLVKDTDIFYFKDASVLIFKNIFNLFPNYFINLFHSNYWKKEIHKDSMGTTVHTFTISRARATIIPIPPLAEQKAIVKIVNQLMAEVGQLEAQTKTRVQLRHDFIKSSLRQLTTADSSSEWKKLQPQFTSFFDTVESIDKLKEAILQLAVQGKLTKQWREDNPDVESASMLLDKIKEEKARLIKEKKIKKEKPLPEISEEEITFELPEGWIWFRFQEVFDIRDGTHDSPKDSLDPDSYPLITSKNFKNGYIDFDSARRISKADYLKVINRSKVHTGDILFSMIGGNIGNQVEVGEQTDFAIKNVALFKHYKYGMPAPGFLRILSKFLAMDLQNQAAGGAQPFVSLKYFRNLIFALPPQEEQNEIIVIVAQLMGYCDQMKTEIENRNILSKDFLRSSIREVMEKTKALA